MRRFSSLSLGLLILAGCGEASDSSIVEVLSEEDPSLPTTSQIFD